MHTEMLAVTRYLGFTKPENSKGQNRKSIPKSRGVFWQSQSTSKPTSLQNMWRFIASSPAALSMQQSEGLLRITKGMINASLREKCGVPSIGGGELPRTVGFSCLPLVPCFSKFCSCPSSLGSCSEVVALVGRWHSGRNFAICISLQLWQAVGLCWCSIAIFASQGKSLDCFLLFQEERFLLLLLGDTIVLL